MNSRLRGWLLPPFAVCLACGILLGRSASSVWGGAAALLLALPACFLLRGRGRFAALLAAALALGCLRGYTAFHPSLPPEGTYLVEGVVTDEVQSVESRRIRTFLSHVKLNGEPCSSGAYWSFYADEIPEGLVPGQAVRFEGSLYHPSGASNPHDYDFREELLRRHASVGLYGAGELTCSAPGFFSFPGFTARLRHRIGVRLTEALGPEAGGYASAMILGSRSMIAREDRAAFSRLGIAHVLSVSGFHVGILVSALALIFRLLHLPQRIRLLLYALILSLYSGLCGFAQPVLRASLLLLLSLEGRILARPRSGLHLLSAVFIGMLLVSPVQLTGLSFQLSFGAMLGLVLITPFLQSLVQPENRALCRLWDGLSAGIGAQLGILLPELYAFQQLPLLGLLANLPVLLISSGLILLFWIVLLTLPVPLLSPLFCSLTIRITSLLLSGLRTLGALPGITLWTPAPTLLSAAAVLGLFAALCVLLRLKGRTRALLGVLSAAVLTLSLIPWPHRTTEYYQFSVGDADAALLWDRDTVLVMDTGYDDGVLSDFLRRHRLTPDGVLLTHLHADHAGGLAAMAEDEIPIRRIYLPAGGDRADIHPDVLALISRLRECGTEIVYLSAGDMLPLPSGDLTVLWPEAGKTRPEQEANESCLVSRLRLMGNTLLQTGDLDGRYEMYAAAPADILKMAHHGSASSTSDAFLASVSPKAVLLSCSREDRHLQVLDRLGGLPLYSTALGGMLTVRFTPSAFTVETFLPMPEVSDNGSNGI